MKKRTISLKTLLLAALRGWKTMLLLGLLAAIVYGGYTFLQLWPQTQIQPEATVAESVISSSEEGVANDSEEATASADYSKNAETVSVLVAKKSEYINNSILAQIDPYHEGRAVVDFYIDTPALQMERIAGEGSADSGSNMTAVGKDESLVGGTAAEIEAASIVRAYRQFIIYEMDWTEMEQKYETSAQYLREIVSVSTSSERNLGTITVKYPSEEGAADILDYVLSQMNGRQGQIEQETTEHALTYANQTSAVVVDSDLFNWLNTRVNEITTLLNTQNSFTTATGALGYTSSASSDDANAQKALGKKVVLKSTIKHAGMGLIGGMVLYLLLAVLYLLVSGVLVDAREFNHSYSFTRLAVIPNPKKRKMDGITRLINKEALQYFTGQSASDGWKIAVLNLKQQMMPEEKLAVVVLGISDDSGNPADNLTDVVDSPNNLAVIRTSSGLMHADDLEILLKADKIVIISQLYKTKYIDVDTFIENFAGTENAIVGSIVLG